MSTVTRSATHAPGAPFRTLSVEDAFDFAEQQVRRLVTTERGKFPTYTEDGRWVFDADPWAPTWSGGFLTGMMWAFAQRTGSRWWREQAEAYSLLLEPRKTDANTHDLGFVLEPSWGRWYDLAGPERARDVLIQGGRTMAGRLRPGGYLCTWVDPGSTFIDVMMNVGIIFRAAEYSGDQRLYDAARAHCRTTRRFLVRGDGSTLHEGWFDTDTGEFLHAKTHQGWRPDSTWVRGHTWAIYGFTTAYRYTGEADMLDTARNTADYYIKRIPDATVPPNDFDDPDPAHPWEASAGSIAAAGMLHLANALDAADPNAAGHYRQYGLRLLTALRSTRFIAADTPGWQGIIQHATYHYRNGLGVDESVMWGDYYFVEALELAARLTTATEGMR